jgi:hypothetical protein
MVEPSTSDEQLRQVALVRIKKRRDFHWHLVTYLVVNALLVFIWALGPRVSFWPMWVLIFWGMGLAFHAWYAFTRQETTEAEVQAEIRRMKGPGSGADD